MKYVKWSTFHLALAKFFSICAQTPSFMFLSEAAFPEILREERDVFCFFFIILLESWHIYSLINNCLHLINSTSFLFIYSFIDFYHSWAMASCAVSRWSWSTSIKDVTNVLAAETRESIKPPAWCVRVSGTTWLTAVILPESEMSSQYGESNS